MLARQSVSMAAAAVVVLAFSAWAQNGSTTADTLRHGEALFLGKLPLEGKPRDHVEYFPAPVVRCVNCHGVGKVNLDGALLLEFRQRRHGPPSAYDQTKFCKLLRTGIDPAYIMIDHAMPIYNVPDGDCAALWTYITQKDAPHAQP